MTVISVSSLVDALHQGHLLEPNLLAQVTRDLQPRFSQPRDLARELVQRGWLTPYQINQIFLGRAADLLLGSYILLERLGEGGMGTVFKAKNWKLGHVVALKLLRKDHVKNSSALKRFQREIRFSSQLDHPGIVRTLDADSVGDQHFLVMEYVEGIDLVKLVRQQGPLPVEQACEYMRQAALGLQHAFERSLVHRDIKPGNLLVTRSHPPQVKILDLGLARLEVPQRFDDTSTGLTQMGTVMGTVDYLAPEQARDAHAADIRADLYSLGCTFYYLLTGKVPFPGGSSMEKLLSHYDQEPAAIEEARPEISPAVVAVVRRLMAKKPQDRFQTPAELAHVLELLSTQELAAAIPVAAPVLTPPPAQPKTSESFALPAEGRPIVTLPPRPLAPPKRAPWMAAGVMMLACGGIASFFFFRLGGSTPSRPDAANAASQWHTLQERFTGDGGDREELYRDVQAFRCRYPGYPEARLAADLLARLPSPWDRLERKGISDEERLDQFFPEGLVGVVGQHRRRHWAGITALVCSRDGRWLASGGNDGMVLLTDLKDLKGPGYRLRHAGRVGGVAFGAGGKILAVSCADGTVSIWDLRSEPLPRGTARGHPGGAGPLALSPDGKRLAVSSGKGQVHSWDVDEADPVPRAALAFPKDFSRLSRIAFAPDGRTLAAVAADSMVVRLWELDRAGLRECNRFPVPGKQLRDLVYRADSKVLVCVTDEAVLLYDLDEAEQEEPLLRVPVAAGDVDLSADGKLLACAGDLGVRLYGLEGTQVRPLTSIPTSMPNTITQVVFTPDGKTLATADSFYRIRLWDCHNPLRLTERDPLTGPVGPVSGLALSPREPLLAAATQDGRVRLWHLEGHSWTVRSDLRVGATTLRQLAFSLDGQWLALGADGEVLRRWDLNGPEPLLQEWEVAGLKRTNGIAFTPDNVLVTAGGGHHLRLYDPVHPREIAAVPNAEALHGLAVSPDGRWLASGSFPGTGAQVWERDKGQVKPFCALPMPSSSLTQVFSPDSDWLACAGTDPRIFLWHLKGGAADKPVELRRHSGKILHLDWSPDGRWLASTGEDARVIIWKMPEGQVAHEYPMPGICPQVSFAPDSRHLAVASSNGVAYVFRVVRR